MLSEEAYYKEYGLSHPAYNVIRVAGQKIQSRAEDYFSGTMLEIGCGTKKKSALVGEYVEVHFGLDLVDTFHDQSSIDVFGTAYELPFESNSCDCVLCTSVLEHLDKPPIALSESYRVLKPGGYGIFTMPMFWHLHEEPRDFYRFTKYGLEYLFKSAGFDIVELIPLSGFWITFGTEFNYYLQKFRRGPTKYILDYLVIFGNLIYPLLDNGIFRDEKFSWLYFMLIRKPH